MRSEVVLDIIRISVKVTVPGRARRFGGGGVSTAVLLRFTFLSNIFRGPLLFERFLPLRFGMKKNRSFYAYQSGVLFPNVNEKRIFVSMTVVSATSSFPEQFAVHNALVSDDSSASLLECKRIAERAAHEFRNSQFMQDYFPAPVQAAETADPRSAFPTPKMTFTQHVVRFSRTFMYELLNRN